MKTLNAFLLSAVLLVGTVASTSAYAGGGRHYRHHHGRIGVFIGAPLVFAPWYYSNRYYYPSTVMVPAEPTVYIEQGQATPSAQPSQAYWYYCPESSTYYPYVNQCAVPWQRVVPRPPPS